VGDTSPVCVECGHSFGPVQVCEQCQCPIPRNEKVCPKCSPKIFQYMGIQPPPKKKKEEPKKPQRPLPPLLNAPRPPETAGPAIDPSSADVLEGTLSHLKPEPAAPAPRRSVRTPPPAPPRSAAPPATGERRMHAGALLLGAALLLLGGALLYPSVSRRLPLPAEHAPLAGYAALALGALELLRGAALKRKISSRCGRCSAPVPAFRRALTVVCGMCGRRISIRFFNILVVIAMLSALAGGAALIALGFSAPPGR
jgi:hypothetical protein